MNAQEFDRHLLQLSERTPEADADRLNEIAGQFAMGFDALRDVGPCVTIFGSARFAQDHRYYRLTRDTAAAFGRAGFAIMSGGGPGVMEAANRGARDVDAESIGATIELPFEQTGNEYIDREIAFRHFFARKVMLVRYSQAFIMMPGGFGTLDELFETATLIQTGKMPGFPMVLMGVEFWNPITDFVTKSLLAEGTIDPGDRDLFVATDEPEEAVRIVEGRLGAS